jgi:hypothetical protein
VKSEKSKLLGIVKSENCGCFTPAAALEKQEKTEKNKKKNK